MKKLKASGLIPSSALGILCAAVLTAVLCLPLAAAANRHVLPLSGAGAAAALAAGLSVLAVTLLIARVRRRQALLSGAIIAAGLAALAALCCALGGAGFAFGGWLPRLGAAALCGGLVGALLSLRGKKGGSRRRK